MACRFEITLPGEDSQHVPAARAALDTGDRLESMLTVFRESSDLVAVNRTAAAGAIAVAQELFDVLSLAAEMHRRTGGAFDVTSTPLSRCWGFLYREGRLPADDEIDAARAVVGMSGVVLDRAARTVLFDRPGLEINLGAIGKGFALDIMAEGLRDAGVTRALLSAGHSSVLAFGPRPWKIDLCSSTLGKPLAHVSLRNGAVGTSGAGEQFVVVDGVRYGHVLDPRTGRPASGTVSASVITTNAAEADALSTAFLIGGSDLARRYCAEHKDVLAVITPEGESASLQVIGSFPGAWLETI
jgi:thiamine biosynthesis lipoprotein